MKRNRGREPRISKAGNHINLTFDSPGTSMTDLDDSDVDPCYNREDLDARFKAIAIDLTSAKEALDASECESAAFRSSIDDLMKVVHDCQHSRRGFISLQKSTKSDLNWFINHLKYFLTLLGSWDLEQTDEYVELKADCDIISNHAVPLIEVGSIRPASFSQQDELQLQTTGRADADTATEDVVSDEDRVPDLHQSQDKDDDGPSKQPQFAQQRFCTGDVVVVNRDCTGDSPLDGLESLGYSALVVLSASAGSLQLQRRSPEDITARRPLAFSGKSEELSDQTVRLALENRVYVDQYKECYGHEDMVFGNDVYYIRVLHSQYGDFIFGRSVTFSGSDSQFTICGVLCSPKGKRRHPGNGNLSLLLVSADGRISKVPISKSVAVSDQPVLFSSEDEIKRVRSILSEVGEPEDKPEEDGK